MAKSSTPKGAKKRVKVKDLPKKEKKLSPDELKKVKGGLSMEDKIMLSKGINPVQHSE
jgi:hypothetical protein